MEFTNCLPVGILFTQRRSGSVGEQRLRGVDPVVGHGGSIEVSEEGVIRGQIRRKSRVGARGSHRDVIAGFRQGRRDRHGLKETRRELVKSGSRVMVIMNHGIPFGGRHQWAILGVGAVSDRISIIRGACLDTDIIIHGGEIHEGV